MDSRAHVNNSTEDFCKAKVVVRMGLALFPRLYGSHDLEAGTRLVSDNICLHILRNDRSIVRS